MNPDHPITVAIVDDHQVLVDALRVVIANEPDMQVVGDASSCAGCLNLVEQTHPAILLLDVGLTDGNGLSLVPHINRISPQTNVLILTSLADESTLLRAIDLGVSGVVGKNRRLSEVLAAIRQAAAGEIAIPVSLLLGLLGRQAKPAGTSGPSRAPQPEDEHPPLTRREREMLTYLAQGKSGAQIAHQLNLSPLTVRTFIRNAIEKLGVHSRIEAVTYALRHGLIDSPL